MCGIAGYNISSKCFEKHLAEDVEKQKALVREGWLHNLHRGTDAAGYMGVVPDTSTTVTFKHGQHAVDLLMNSVDKKDFNIKPMQTFGVHTRAMTIGPAKLNENNHPVQYNGIHVTHNGHISNHTSLRNQYVPFQERAGSPLVDSWVIPVVLDEFIDTPLNPKGIMAALRQLEGAFAIHAIWTAFPGISVIARGSGRPLVLAHNDGEGFFYGSEPESVWAIMDTLGVDPNNKRWSWDSLDSDKFLVIDNGELVKWGGFKKPLTSSGPVTTTRWLPKEKNVNKKAQKVYETDSQYDFLNKHPIGSIRGNESKAELRYDRRRGFINKADENEGFPFNGENSVGSVIAEADKVYWFEDYWHIFSNNIEIVMNDHRVIKDIFNHDLFKNEERFSKKSNPLHNANYVPGGDLTSEDFMRFHLSAMKAQDIPFEADEYEYVLEQRRVKEREDRQNSGKEKPQLPSQVDSSKTGKTSSMPVKNGGANSERKEVTSTFEAEGDEDDENVAGGIKMIDPPTELTWDNFFAATFAHADNEFHFVGENRLCPQHDQLLSTHTEPELCETVLLAATYAMAAATNLDILSIMDREFELRYDWTNEACYDAENKRDLCNWKPNQYVKVTAAHSAWLICVGEICEECYSLREMSELPSWFSLLDVSDVLVVIPGGK